MSSLREQWDSYGSRPPIARWTARVSMLVGLAIGIVLVVAVFVGVAWLSILGWRLVLG